MDELSKFIKENAELINNNDFNAVYLGSFFYSDLLRGKFTDVLYDAGIDPLKYLDITVPPYFAYNCKCLPKELTVLSKVSEIGDNAFRGSNLQHINLPEGLKTISFNAFYECEQLTEITVPKSVTEIGYAAFFGTSWYDKQPDGLLYINNILHVYKGIMPNNMSITVKDGTVSISDGAFQYRGIKEITIPHSMKEIGKTAFRGCVSLEAVHYDGTIIEWNKMLGSTEFDKMTRIICNDGEVYQS